MRAILEGIFKGFIQWIYGLCLEIVQYIANSLLNVFQMDLDYFRQVAPVTDDILSIVIAVGWALLLGNLVFQATKSMATGLGFEGEDPKLLFTRTFVFGFLLLASQQICDIGLGISAQVISLLQVPSSVTITIPDENNFDLGASWLLIIIVGFVIMWQFVKLCFEVAERYVVTAILVLLSPLAFGMGGSKNTEDIFKGWCRMFGSMCVMMVMNVIFLKLLISALGYMPSGVAVMPWMLLIVGIARVARKALAGSGEPSRLKEVEPEKLTAKDVFDAAKEGDRVANEVVEDVCRMLASALAKICVVVNPEAILIGGGVSKAGQILLDAIEEPFRGMAFHACQDTKILLASLGNDAGIYGAAKNSRFTITPITPTSNLMRANF